MTGKIITQETVMKERINGVSLDLDFKNVSAVLTYFFVILKIAVEIGITNNVRKNEITEFLTRAFEKDTNGNMVCCSNKIYVFSAWLMTFSNWEAWQKLNEVTDFESACKLYDEADEWYRGVLGRIRSFLRVTEKNVLKINNTYLTKEYLRMKALIKTLETYSVKPEICFKNEHITRNQMVFQYIFLEEPSGKNVIEFLKNAFYAFSMEMQIFTKIRGKEFSEISISDYNNSENDKVVMELELKQSYETQIKMLEAEKKEALNNAMVFNMDYNKFSKAKKAKVSRELIQKNDPITIEKNYDEEISKIREEWSKAASKFDELIYKVNELEGDLILQDSPTLSSLLNEVALHSIYERGFIKYTNSRIKKGMLLSRISRSFAINELTNSRCMEILSPLSETEITFIKKAFVFEPAVFEQKLEELKKLSEQIEELNFLQILKFAEENDFLS